VVEVSEERDERGTEWEIEGLERCETRFDEVSSESLDELEVCSASSIGKFEVRVLVSPCDGRKRRNLNQS